VLLCEPAERERALLAAAAPAEIWGLARWW